MTLKLVLDRYEEGIGVCLDFDDKKYLIPQEILGDIKENDVFNIELDGERFHSPQVLIEETNNRKEHISKRMKRLFNISKNRRPPRL